MDKTFSPWDVVEISCKAQYEYLGAMQLISTVAISHAHYIGHTFQQEHKITIQAEDQDSCRHLSALKAGLVTVRLTGIFYILNSDPYLFFLF